MQLSLCACTAQVAFPTPVSAQFSRTTRRRQARDPSGQRPGMRPMRRCSAAQARGPYRRAGSALGSAGSRRPARRLWATTMHARSGRVPPGNDAAGPHDPHSGCPPRCQPTAGPFAPPLTAQPAVSPVTTDFDVWRSPGGPVAVRVGGVRAVRRRYSLPGHASCEDERDLGDRPEPGHLLHAVGVKSSAGQRRHQRRGKTRPPRAARPPAG
jgi:hypothetical protein